MRQLVFVAIACLKITDSPVMLVFEKEPLLLVEDNFQHCCHIGMRTDQTTDVQLVLETFDCAFL